jgi:hypothetical protein
MTQGAEETNQLQQVHFIVYSFFFNRSLIWFFGRKTSCALFVVKMTMKSQVSTDWLTRNFFRSNICGVIETKRSNSSIHWAHTELKLLRLLSPIIFVLTVKYCHLVKIQVFFLFSFFVLCVGLDNIRSKSPRS